MWILKKILDKIRRIFIILPLVYFVNLIHKNVHIDKSISYRSGLKLIITKDANLKIGKGCFFNNFCSINCLYKIQIGDNCIFGENVKIYDHNHRYKNNGLIKEQGYSLGEIKIGQNCWFGSNVTILKGVTIGDNVVVGANCVIYKDVPSNSVIVSKIEYSVKNYTIEDEN